MSSGRDSRSGCLRAGWLWLSLGLALILVPVTVLASVSITGFTVQAGTDAIYVSWETGSEIGNLGFYVLRSQSETGTYERLPLGTPSEQFIPSDDFGVGASYDFTDVQVTPGIRYYYKVQDIPASGAPETVGPESAMIPLPATATATATVAPPTTAAPSPTPTSTSQPGSTPVASVRFWADPETVQAGDCTTLQWRVDQVRAVFFNGTPVTGQGAQAVCPCEPQTHTLRVQYQDGRWEEFPLTVSVTGTCGAGTGSSALATPRPVTLTPTPQPTRTPVVPTAQADAIATPTPTPSATPTIERMAAPVRESPLQTPVPDVDLSEEPFAVEDVVDPLNRPSPTPTAATRSVGPVEAYEPVGRGLGVAWLVLAAVVGTGMVGGGIWLWKRN